MNGIENTIVEQKALRIKFKAGNEIVFEDVWLRDHCRCSSCYHADTFQRAQYILDIPETLIHEVQHDDSNVFITWDDSHKSNYSVDFLSRYDYKNWSDSKKLHPVLWQGKSMAGKINAVPVSSFINSVEGAREVFQSLLDYGVALIKEVDVSVDGTEEVCKALGGVQHTIFGGMWRFTTKADHADTAYTNLPLAVHNDNTYFTEAAGYFFNKEGGDVYPLCHLLQTALKDEDFFTSIHKIPIHSAFERTWTQVLWKNRQRQFIPHVSEAKLSLSISLQILHCLEHSNGTGGETLLVDGFYGAKKLQEEKPEDFEFLASFNIEAEYIEPGHHHTYSAPVVRVDPDTKQLVQIRFNVYDRAPMAFANKELCRAYYRSLKNLARIYQEPENQWKFKLKPGLVLVMDNFRVLHGRTAFTGNRVLSGSYVARSDWLDRARNLELIS